MINLLNNDLGLILKDARLLSDTLIWFQSFDINLKNKILDWIKNDQLQKGIDEDGDIIGLYSKWTEIINPLKIEGTPFTLKDTGDFYRSLFITILTDSFIIDGDAQKSAEDNLFEKYGDGIVGLTDQNLDKLSDELMKKYEKYIKQILQIN